MSGDPVLSGDPALPPPQEEREPSSNADLRNQDELQKRIDGLRETLEKIRQQDPFAYPTS